ncbi:hypothetical protein Poli38472_001434 [Pythium oligandrum]|uniref:Uncharacterized protein n=1 Tax=Pythium oligandrum TaxID=41045 RepID=A0A8K1CW08_PYTOL|nr:hypothetical protein Poli38472_001434 [Pythium oligandrum]|eukprot:TMW69278.1 hypothetical protein Poli38472_001434 [Pythium oligandrum]
MTPSTAMVAPSSNDANNVRIASASTLSFRTRPIQVTLTDTTIRRLWRMILFVRFLSIVQLYMMASIYLSHKYRPNSFLKFLSVTFLSPAEQAFIDQYAVWIGFSYVLIAVFFAWSMARMIWEALYHHQLWFADVPIDSSPSRRRFFRSRSFISPLVARLPTSVKHYLDILNAQLWMLWVGYGVRGERFEGGFMVRELLEMALQTIQAEATSRTISSTFINQSYGALIGLSAIINPILYHVFANRPSTKRFACVLIEFFIDFVWAVILPFCMMFPYVFVDRTLSADQIIEQFEIGYYEKAQREIRHIVILSWRAYILSIFPSLSVYSSLEGTTKLLAVAKRVDFTKNEDKTAKKARLFYQGGRIHGSDCRLRLSPWFISDDACVVVFINCKTLNITGRRDELVDIFSTIHMDSLGFLGINNCPALELPKLEFPESFHSVVTISITQSTIAVWPEEIALTTANFPNLLTLYLGQSTLPSPPPSGLLGSSWPDSLLRLVIMELDVNELAQRLTTQWRGISSFYCISCGLKTFPTAVFAASKLKVLMIVDSDLPSMSTPEGYSLPSWPHLEAVMFAHTPHLSSIDDGIWETAVAGTTRFVTVAFTNISTIPLTYHQLLPSPPALKVFGYASPLCTRPSTPRIPALDCAPLNISLQVLAQKSNGR